MLVCLCIVAPVLLVLLGDHENGFKHTVSGDKPLHLLQFPRHSDSQFLKNRAADQIQRQREYYHPTSEKSASVKNNSVTKQVANSEGKLAKPAAARSQQPKVTETGGAVGVGATNVLNGPTGHWTPPADAGKYKLQSGQ